MPGFKLPTKHKEPRTKKQGLQKENRRQIQRLIESEENEDLKQLLVQNWTTARSAPRPAGTGTGKLSVIGCRLSVP